MAGFSRRAFNRESQEHTIEKWVAGNDGLSVDKALFDAHEARFEKLLRGST